MNIFVFDPNPEICAKMHDDVRLRKMIVEYAQILSTVTGVGYKPTHKNHPCVKWAEKFNNRAGYIPSLCFVLKSIITDLTKHT